MKANLKVLVLAALSVLVNQAGHAGPVGPLTTFTAGTPAKASEVNGNFSAVSTAVNANDGRITTLESAITPAGNIVLVPSTASAGNILKGTTPFIHNFGTDNTFIGVNAGNFTMSGPQNTGSGVSALFANTTGNSNTANGAHALQSNTIGSANTASGANALQNNTTGANNSANGGAALFANTTGSSNTASGSVALASNTTGSENTASGWSALLNNGTGFRNTASGVHTLENNTTGSNNTASGAYALINNTTGSDNIAIGYNAGGAINGNNNIDIGHQGIATDANTIRIGNGAHTATFIAGIRGITTGSAAAIPVLIDINGQLGTASSSRRVKDDIADMGTASSALMKLRPVTFHYKSDKNPKSRTLQYGLIAEEVGEVAPGLVAHSADDRIETVYYQFLAPMLLNEYQKQERTIEAQTARIAQLEKQSAEIADLKLQLTQMAGLLGRLERAERVATARWKGEGK
jgi:hypothetical protein